MVTRDLSTVGKSKPHARLTVVNAHANRNPGRTSVRATPKSLALSDAQLAVVANAAKSLPVEKRSLLLQRVSADLQFPSGDSIDRAVERALRGLLHGPVA